MLMNQFEYSMSGRRERFHKRTFSEYSHFFGFLKEEMRDSHLLARVHFLTALPRLETVFKCIPLLVKFRFCFLSINHARWWANMYQSALDSRYFGSPAHDISFTFYKNFRLFTVESWICRHFLNDGADCTNTRFTRVYRKCEFWNIYQWIQSFFIIDFETDFSNTFFWDNLTLHLYVLNIPS